MKAGGRALDAPLRFAIAVLCLATVLAAAGRWSWFCDLFTHFRPHLAAGLALTCGLALLLRQRRMGWIAAAGLMANALYVAPVVWPEEPVAVTDGQPVRVVSYNIAFFNPDIPAVGPYVESLQADVVALQEVPGDQMAALLARLPSYPHHYLAANTGSFGVIVVSRWPLEEMRVARLGIRDAAQVVVVFPDARLTLTALHLTWPMTGESAQQRNAEMVALAAPATVAMPRHLRGSRRLQRDALVDAFPGPARGFGTADCARQPSVPQTWPSWRVPLRLRIDQCLANSNVEVTPPGLCPGSGLGSPGDDQRIADRPPAARVVSFRPRAVARA